MEEDRGKRRGAPEARPGPREDSLPGTGRIEAFSDGVIAIIITIMILELKVPAESIVHGSLAGVVRELGPNLLAYGLSFLIVAIMLLNHHSIMRVAGYATNGLYWWNANLLFWMSLIPLATASFGQAPEEPLAVALYGAVMLCNGMSFTFLRRYAGRLSPPDPALADFNRRNNLKNAVSAGLYALSIPLAYVSVVISIAIFVLVAMAYFLPSRMSPER
jgi:uncharacterized membrane protein